MDEVIGGLPGSVEINFNVKTTRRRTRHASVVSGKDKKKFYFFFKDPGIPEARGAGACARPRTLGPGLIDRRSYLLIPLSLFLVDINIFSLFLFLGMYTSASKEKGKKT